jgi:sec-independent protein translocase protein TatA
MLNTTVLAALGGMEIAKIPELMRGLGKGMKEFKDGKDGVDGTDAYERDRTNPNKPL